MSNSFRILMSSLTPLPHYVFIRFGQHAFFIIIDLRSTTSVYLRTFQETLDTGDDGSSGSQENIEYVRRKRRLRRKQNKLPWSVVNPDENFYFNWLMVLTGCTLYNLWTAIVRQSLPELQRIASGWWSAVDAFSDIVFLLDVAVQFRTGYLEQGLMVYNTSKLAGHYIRSRSFLLDLAALTPLDLLQLKIGVHPILRFPRFIKVTYTSTINVYLPELSAL